MTFLAEVECAFNERPKYVLEQNIEDNNIKRTSSLQDLSIPEVTVENEPKTGSSSLEVSSHNNQHLRSRSIDVNMHNSRKVRAGSDNDKRKDRRFVNFI